MKKCPNGFYAEIKYDGERVQVHKKGDTFEFFSRSLKNVQPNKVRTIHNITYGSDLIVYTTHKLSYKAER